ncbi:glycosyltransferase WbuB [Niallia circulans]|uniref:glycosyltransferase family 4 protein n=1 Tax=Niallia circulans TaxID=1397 RepID=UPI00201D3DAE|nr:glycosyltransferase family 4 protein [Niallia circulans]UQZ75700.1 glycosyltransferase WbuB [Niallia circulans]
MKKKIVFVINYFYPDLASTGQLLTELCLELQNDFEITVIAAQPGYVGEKNEANKLFERDKLEDINIIRIKLPKVVKSSKFSRIKYIGLYFIFALIALLKERKVDVIYTISQPPILGGLIGTIGKLIKRKKHIYNIQDFNPEQAAAVNYSGNKIIYKIAMEIDKINCKYSDKVIVVGNDMTITLRNRFKQNKIPNYSVINNWTDESEIIPLSKQEPKIVEFKNKYKLNNKFIIMYSGNLGLYYDLENIISVAKEFKHNKEILFVFIGDGAIKKKMQEYAMNNDLNNVLFLPYQEKSFIKYSLNVADVHLVVNQKGIKGVSVPSKIYGVMAAGKPILGVLENGSEAEFLISHSKSGVIVEPQNYKMIIEKIKYLYNLDKLQLEKMGYNGRKYLDANLKKSISISKYRELLKNI